MSHLVSISLVFVIIYIRFLSLLSVLCASHRWPVVSTMPFVQAGNVGTAFYRSIYVALRNRNVDFKKDSFLLARARAKCQASIKTYLNQEEAVARLLWAKEWIRVIRVSSSSQSLPCTTA